MSNIVLQWKQVPTEVREVFEPYLLAHLDLLPTWCHEVVIDWDDEATDACLKTSFEKEYRRGFLWVCPGWLSKTEERRRWAVLHEVMHFTLEPIQNASLDVLNFIKEKHPEAHDLLTEQRRYALEETIGDLVYLLHTLGR